jgi:HemY protein
LQAASWALQDIDAGLALDYLGQVTPGAARRTYGLKIRLRADQMAGKVEHALETARLLAKHKAFTAQASASLLRGLVQQVLRQSHDMQQLSQNWQRLSSQEQSQMALVTEGSASLARSWLLPAWDNLVGGTLQGVADQEDFTQLILALQPHVSGLEPHWLARIEKAQVAHPQYASLTYLAGIACMERQLWGKAESLLGQAAPQLKDKRLSREAWRALGALAELRDQNEAAARYYKQAALLD